MSAKQTEEIKTESVSEIIGETSLALTSASGRKISVESAIQEQLVSPILAAVADIRELSGEKGQSLQALAKLTGQTIDLGAIVAVKRQEITRQLAAFQAAVLGQVNS